MMDFVDLHRLSCEVPGAREVLAYGCRYCRARQRMIGLIKRNLGEAGGSAGECRIGALEVGLAASLRRTVALFSNGWKRLWRGCLIVGWDGARPRILWRWGKV